MRTPKKAAPTVVAKGPGTVRWKVGQAVAWTAAGVRDKAAAKKAEKARPEKS